MPSKASGKARRRGAKKRTLSLANRNKDPKYVNALKRFMEEKNLNRRQVASIIDIGVTQMRFVSLGVRPYSKTLARLYILTEDEDMAPDSDNELEAYDRESKSPPDTITKYKETGFIPNEPTPREPPPKRDDHDPRFAKIVRDFMKKHQLNFAQLGRIIGQDSRTVHCVSDDKRPYSTTVARLCLLISDPWVQPKTDREKETYEKERENPPPSIAAFLEDGTIPPPKSRSTTGARQETSSEPAPAPSAPKSSRPPAPAPAPTPESTQASGPPNEPPVASIEAPAPVAPESTPPVADREPKLIFSPHFDRILSGVAEIEGQFQGPMRFVLTAENFRQLDGGLSELEIEDTKLLIIELRRRFSIFAQLQDREERAKLIAELGAEINELYITIENSRSELPIEAAHMMADLRLQLVAFRSPFGGDDS